MLSVTVTVYVPAERPVAVAFVCAGLVFHEYVYPGVPPAAVTVAEPFMSPLQDALVWAVMDDVRAEGSVIFTEAVV